MMAIKLSLGNSIAVLYFFFVQLAGLKVELNMAKDELEDTINKQDFSKAAELKQKIEDLEMTRESLLEETMNKTVVQEVRTEKVQNKLFQTFYSLVKYLPLLKLLIFILVFNPNMLVTYKKKRRKNYTFF